MGLIQESDVGKVLADQEFMDQVVSGLIEDSSTMDTLVDEIAGNVQDALENDSDLRQRLVSAAMSNETFKQKLVDKLIAELADD
ncbi:MAG: hypothetical protein IH963_13035 [Chloroflexi bacterium]|nr:hypothetical protein [Chloroflexota bacterium]MCH8801823.1 hypothetical protein [Chloroflexota bacterium]